MKIVLLINKNNVSHEGIYRINEIYKTFFKEHSILLVQCKNEAIENIIKKPFLKKIKSTIVKGPIKYINSLLLSYIKNTISKKVKNSFGNIEISKHIEYVRVDSNDINGREAEAKLNEISPDLIIHISSNILKSTIFTIPKIGTLNLHHGVLPYIRGLDSIYWGIFYGKYKWVGATVHFINDGIDTGEIIVKKQCELENKKNLHELIVLNEKNGTELLIESINLLNNVKLYNTIPVKNKFEEVSVYKSRASLWVVFIVLFKVKFRQLFNV
jgi:folate-dependent phosphoribosylglycinamide formyltransferase PurN